MKTTIIAALALLLTGGCASTRAVTMRSPDGRVATCGPFTLYGMPGLQAAALERSCVDDFQRQGFERVPD